jgi:hypothetical protein
MSSTETARALRELDETTAEVAELRRKLAHAERTQTARMIRAVAVGATRGEVAEVTGHSRQRVQQITAGVDRGNTDRAAVKVLARAGRPRQQVNSERRALLAPPRKAPAK